MELSVLERLLILNLDTLPRVGSIITIKTKQQLLTDCGFSEEEIKDGNIRDEDGQVKWDKDFPKDVSIGDAAKKLLIDAMEKSENVSDMYVPLYDKLKA
jgi:hypothetical protein